MLRSLPIDQVRIGDRLRKTDPDRVRAIGESIAEIGLQMPISVAESERWEDGRKLSCFDLVTGMHRLMACRALGHQEIEAKIVDLIEIDRQIWECDENLARANLTPAAEARFLARRKELYEIKHPETRQHVAGAHASNQAQGNATDNLSAASFAADTAAKTGESERTVRRAVRRGENIADDVLDKIEGTSNDKGVVLDRLAKMEPKKQREAVKRLEQGKPLPAPKPKPRADQESNGLSALKRAWHSATDTERAAFLAWTQSKGDVA